MLLFFQKIGFGEIVIIVGIIALIFGAKRLPALGRSLGKSLREFKKGMSGEDEQEKTNPPAEEKEKDKE
jgi:sec-independent protein translocase protein TatA